MNGKMSVFSVGEVARRLGVALHQVDYVLKSRGIEPTAIAGGRRLYGEDEVGMIADALRIVDQFKKGGAR